MDQIKLLKKRNDLSRFIGLLTEESIDKIEEYLINENFEVELEEDKEVINDNLLLDSLSLDEDESMLTEEVKTKLKTIFDAVVLEKVNQETAKIEETVQEFITENQNSVDEYAHYVKSELEKQNEEKMLVLEENLNEYLDYVINEWIEENKIEIETGIKAEISDSVLSGLKKLFESNHIVFPQEEISLIKELEDNTKNLTEEKEELSNQVTQLKKQYIIAKKQLILEELSTGLTDLDKDRLVVLSESVKSNSFDDYKNKLGLLKNKFISKSVSGETQEAKGDRSELLNESIGSKVVNENIDDRIKAYADAIANQVVAKK